MRRRKILIPQNVEFSLAGNNPLCSQPPIIWSYTSTLHVIPQLYIVSTPGHKSVQAKDFSLGLTSKKPYPIRKLVLDQSNLKWNFIPTYQTAQSPPSSNSMQGWKLNLIKESSKHSYFESSSSSMTLHICPSSNISIRFFHLNFAHL